jgi:hypothetical protein
VVACAPWHGHHLIWLLARELAQREAASRSELRATVNLHPVGGVQLEIEFVLVDSQS